MLTPALASSGGSIAMSTSMVLLYEGVPARSGCLENERNEFWRGLGGSRGVSTDRFSQEHRAASSPVVARARRPASSEASGTRVTRRDRRISTRHRQGGTLTLTRIVAPQAPSTAPPSRHPTACGSRLPVWSPEKGTERRPRVHPRPHHERINTLAHVTHRLQNILPRPPRRRSAPRLGKTTPAWRPTISLGKKKRFAQSNLLGAPISRSHACAAPAIRRRVSPPMRASPVRVTHSLHTVRLASLLAAYRSVF